MRANHKVIFTKLTKLTHTGTGFLKLDPDRQKSSVDPHGPAVPAWCSIKLFIFVFRLRSKVERASLSLLDLRNYLFARQGLLLIQIKNPEEVARRCLSFIHNTLQVERERQHHLGWDSTPSR